MAFPRQCAFLWIICGSGRHLWSQCTSPCVEAIAGDGGDPLEFICRKTMDRRMNFAENNLCFFGNQLWAEMYVGSNYITMLSLRWVSSTVPCLFGSVWKWCRPSKMVLLCSFNREHCDQPMDLEVAHFQRKPFSSRGPQPRRGDTAGVKHVAAARSGCVDLGLSHGPMLIIVDPHPLQPGWIEVVLWCFLSWCLM